MVERSYVKREARGSMPRVRCPEFDARSSMPGVRYPVPYPFFSVMAFFKKMRNLRYSVTYYQKTLIYFYLGFTIVL